MFSDVKKLHLIQEVLQISNETTLLALEEFLNKIKFKAKEESAQDSLSFTEFSGIWSTQEADELKRIIEESCEAINPDDWK